MESFFLRVLDLILLDNTFFLLSVPVAVQQIDRQTYCKQEEQTQGQVPIVVGQVQKETDEPYR